MPNNPLPMLMLFFLLLVLTANCTRDKSNPAYAGSENFPPETLVNVAIAQKPGCAADILAKAAGWPECFSYQFQDTLKIDFCVSGNCCPDSNRFTYEYAMYGDTIKVAVADTAERRCRCICRYMIQLKIPGLLKNQYRFYCKYPDDDETAEYCLYDEEIVRGK